jgi:hypothetical protein
MARAEDFVKSFKKWTELLWNNKPKNMAIFVYIYARDIDARTETDPDWEIRTDKLASRSKFDDYRIRQDIDDFIRW